MKHRPKWSHVVISLGVIAAIAIAAPALGINKSIKKAIRKEVARQIGKASGPPGPAGTNGTNGTARAYATVSRALDCSGGPPEATCPISRAKGITSVTHLTSIPGRFCVTAPGIDARSVSAAVTVDLENTGTPEGNASAMEVSDPSSCGSNGRFQVDTQRQPVITIGADEVAGDATGNDDVAFTIVIP